MVLSFVPAFGPNRIRMSTPDFPQVAASLLTTRGRAAFEALRVWLLFDRPPESRRMQPLLLSFRMKRKIVLQV